MTMKRDEKNEATGTIKSILAGGKIPAQSPRLRAAMIADHGAPTYTAQAWREARMGRGRMDGSRLETRIEQRRTAKIRSLRKITKR